MANADPPSRASIVAQHSPAQQSGKSTPPASQKLKNIKSRCTNVLRRYVGTLHSLLISLIRFKGQGSRPGNGHQRHSQLKTTNANGKYHHSHSSQSSWPRHQYIRNCASGANSTPLGSPRRMSPVDNSAVQPSPSVTNATTKTEPVGGKKRDSEVCLYVHKNTLADSRLH